MIMLFIILSIVFTIINLKIMTSVAWFFFANEREKLERSIDH